MSDKDYEKVDKNNPIFAWYGWGSAVGIGLFLALGAGALWMLAKAVMIFNALSS
ncbi:MAG TPA: hypothetical protein VF466_00460 [Candidatus Saccharimonadales bacterium]